MFSLESLGTGTGNPYVCSTCPMVCSTYVVRIYTYTGKKFLEVKTTVPGSLVVHT
jgi:hypothetical protein